MKAVTASAMRELERRAAGFGLTGPVLMQLAGLSVAVEIDESFGGVRGRRVLVLVGPGNNGGDGLVTAFNLHDRGAQVGLYLWNRKTEGDGNYALCLKRGISTVEASSDPDFGRLHALLSAADIAVDALLGIGISRPITGTLRGILETVEEIRKGRPNPPTEDSRPFLVALDIPTGLNSDTGEVENFCFHADLTVTLGYPKVGLFIFPGAACVGRLATREIGIPSELADDIPTQVLSAGYVKSLLPARPLDANKGTFGKVLVVGGSTNYVGAPVMAALAALRAGAGLVTLATAQSLQAVMAAKLTEATFLPLPEAQEGVIGLGATQPVLEALRSYDVLVIGSGLGRHPETVEFVQDTLELCPLNTKVVVDADGLNALSAEELWWGKVRGELVVTPHPGEMSRLTAQPIGHVNARRIDVARESAAKWGKVVVLKGAFSLIASPDGTLNINPYANPALASAGTGDVLSGVIGGLLAQGMGAFGGASAGVFLHAEAGKMVSRELGDAGLLAGDLVGQIPEAIKTVKHDS